MNKQIKLLALNFKHYYQKRACWLVYAFVAFTLLTPFGLTMVYGGQGANELSAKILLVLFYVFMLNMILGLLSGDMVRTVSITPFSYCLPGYKKLPIRLLLTATSIINVLYTVFVAMVSGSYGKGIIVIFAFGMLTFAVFALAALTMSNPAGLFGFLGFLGLGGLVVEYTGNSLLWSFIDSNALCLSIVLLVMVWFLLSRFDVRRNVLRFLGKPKLDLFSVYNIEKMRLYADYKTAMKKNKETAHIKKSYPGLRIIESATSMPLKYALGIFYIFKGAYNCCKWGYLIWFVFMVLICYLPMNFGFPARLILFLSPCFAANQLANSLRLPLLLGCGRRERFGGVLIVGGIYILLFGAFLTVVIAVTRTVGLVMPKVIVPYYGLELIFKPFEIWYLLPAMITAPFVYAMSVINNRTGVFASLGILYLVVVVATIDIITEAGLFDMVRQRLFITLPVIAAFWLGCVGIIRQRIIKNDHKCLQY